MFNKKFHEAIETVYDCGVEATPRGTKTKEIIGFQTRIDSKFPILISDIRKPQYPFMVAEWLWMLFGRNDVEFISRFSKKIANYSDNGKTFFGAYGPRISSQLKHVYETLKRDEHSRQAVLTVWIENPKKTLDYPCTVGLHFMIRNNKLNLFSWMRSNDAWTGFPYDVFNFCQILNYMTGLLNGFNGYDSFSGRCLERGEYIHNADSFHLYDHDWSQVDKLIGKTPSDKMLSPRSISFKEYDFYDEFYNHINLSKVFNENVPLLLKGEFPLHELAKFPVGIIENIAYLNDYCRGDGSHRKNLFWREVYSK